MGLSFINDRIAIAGGFVVIGFDTTLPSPIRFIDSGLLAPAARRDALRQLLFLKTQPDKIGFGGGDLPEAISQTQYPQHGSIDAEADRWVAALDTQQSGPADLSAFSNHGSRQPATATRALNVLT